MAFHEIILDSPDYRPETQVGPRFANAIKGVISTIPNESWPFEEISFKFFTGLMTDLNIAKLTAIQQGFICKYFETTMYFNRYLDPYVDRLQPDKLESHIFLEKFWNLPDRIRILEEKGKIAGFTEESLKTISDWFETSRTVNVLLNQLSKGQNCYPLKDGADLPPISQAVIEAYNWWSNRGDLTQAILLRSISSMTYGRTLASLVANRGLGPDDIGIMMRIGSMVMITQLIDDFATPSKDAKYHIAGIIKTAFEKSGLNDQGGILVTPDDTRKAAAVCHGVIRGCLDQICIDPRSRMKQNIAKDGLLGIASVASAVMAHKYGGTLYPIEDLLTAVADELRHPLDKDNKYRQITRQALKTAVSIVC
jgi:hypothetical protein